MATSVAPATATGMRTQAVARDRVWGEGFVVALAATPLAFFVQGYHPYSEDGGLYLAGVKLLLQPELFPHDRAFVAAHLHYSVFAPVVAGAVRASGLPVEAVTLMLHLACLVLTLWGVWAIAAACFRRRAERVGSVLLTAVWLNLPVAGTSLALGDPYLTARSVTTPCVLWAMAVLLRGGRRWWLGTGTLLAVAASFHPLMAGFGIAAIGVLAFLQRSDGAPCWREVGVCGGMMVGVAVVLAAGLRFATGAASAAYRAAALSRAYWFLQRWQWYELIGLVAPAVLLTVLTWRVDPSDARGAARLGLSRMALVMSVAGVTVAVLFVRVGSEVFRVASLQPLRCLQVVYFVFVLLLGGVLGGLWRPTWGRTVAAVVGLAGLTACMVVAQRAVYPASPTVEVGQRGNAWVEAFRWVRGHTAPDALVALDADFISKAGEDAQGFRSVAERSMLPDASKDGGEAAITPALAEAWVRGVRLQTGLSTLTDAERVRRLRGAGVSWVVLDRSAQTTLPCPYRNEAVEVCALR